MIDGLRTEFPGATGAITRLRRPMVGGEPTLSAFVCAIGAGSIVGGIVGVLLIAAAPWIFSSTEPHPSWLTYPIMTRTAAAIAAGAVAVRTGGLRALAVYVLYELLQTAAALPGRSLSCSRAARLDPSLLGPCDLPGLIVSRWSTWLALAIGTAMSSWLTAAGPVGPNRMLRAAGVFGLVLTAATSAYSVLTIATLDFRSLGLDNAFTSAYLISELVAGVLAGLILGRSRSAATVLVGLLVMSGLAATLPNMRANWIPSMPLQMMFLSYSGAFAPLVGAIGIVAGWTVGRRRAT